MQMSRIEQQLDELKSLLLEMRSEMRQHFDPWRRDVISLQESEAEPYTDLRERVSIINDKLSAMQREFDRLRRDIENPDRFTLKP